MGSEMCIRDSNKRRVEGKMVTPFLLSYIHEKTKGKSLDVNISLALNNVQLGAKIAKSLNARGG